MSYRASILGVAAMALAYAAAGLPGRAYAQTAVDLELVLAVDVSLSMDPDEQRLQRDGYVQAFRDADVLTAIRSNRHGRIAVAYVEWAGASIQRVTIPWTLVDGPEAAERLAAQLEREPITRAQRTSISGTLAFSARLFEGSSFKGTRRVIDVSGDGPNNDGPPVEAARDAVLARGITINGLPIMIKETTGWFDLPNLDEYYEDCVIGGFGAFAIATRDRGEFARTIKRKLLLEIADQRGSLLPTQDKAADPETIPKRVDCLVGEKRWQQYMGGRRAFP